MWIGGENGRVSRKYIRLCKSRLYRLCCYDKSVNGEAERHIFGIIK